MAWWLALPPGLPLILRLLLPVHLSLRSHTGITDDANRLIDRDSVGRTLFNPAAFRVNV